MRFQTRKRDARKVERIDPRVLQQRITTGMAGGERAVELGIMRDYFRISHEFYQIRQGIGWKWRIRHVLVVDIGQIGDILRNRLPRVHERDEPVDDPPLLHAGGGDLRQLVVIERETGRLGVEDHDIAIKIPIIAFSGDCRQRSVTRLDSRRRPIAYKSLQDTMRLLAVLFHNDQPTISQLFVQTKTPLPG